MFHVKHFRLPFVEKSYTLDSVACRDASKSGQSRKSWQSDALLMRYGLPIAGDAGAQRIADWRGSAVFGMIAL